MKFVAPLLLLTVLVAGCQRSPNSSDSGPAADISKIECNVYYETVIQQKGKPPTVRRAEVTFKNLNPYPVKSIRVKARFSFRNSPLKFEVERLFDKDLRSVGNLYQGILLPMHSSKADWVDIPVTPEAWRNDSVLEVTIVDAQRASAPTKVTDAPGLIAMMFERKQDEVMKAFKDNPELLKIRTKTNATPLHLAVLFGDVNVFDFLMAQGLDPKATSNRGHNLLHYGALSTPEMIRHVAKLGVRPTLTSESSYSPLHYAVEMGNLDAIEPLVKAGADPNARTRYKVTPLLHAIQRYHPRLAVEMKRLGGRTDVFDNRGVGPMGFAVGTSSLELLDEMLKHNLGKVNEKSPTGMDPIFLSVDWGRPDVFVWLVKHGADPNDKSVRGESTLEYLKRTRLPGGYAMWNKALAEVGLPALW